MQPHAKRKTGTYYTTHHLLLATITRLSLDRLLMYPNYVVRVRYIKEFPCQGNQFPFAERSSLVVDRSIDPRGDLSSSQALLSLQHSLTPSLA